MNYLKHFQLDLEPFSSAPVSSFYFNSPQHSQAMVRLMFAVDNMRGLALCVGDIGAGKTTLARRLLEQMPEDQYEAALLVIIHSGITASWLLRRIALQLGVPEPSEDKLTLLSQLYQRLVSLYEEDKKAVVLIDEAQMLHSREIMEEFRGLLNLEVPERKLLSFVFFGLPELDQNLMLDPPLAQRVAMRYRLEPLNLESTDVYIKHRLRMAASRKMLFTSLAVEQIYKATGGVPRLINTLCDNTLFEAALSRKRVVDGELVKQTGKNLGMHQDEEVSDAVGEPKEAGIPAAGKSPADQNPMSEKDRRVVSMNEIDKFLNRLRK